MVHNKIIANAGTEHSVEHLVAQIGGSPKLHAAVLTDPEEAAPEYAAFALNQVLDKFSSVPALTRSRRGQATLRTQLLPIVMFARTIVEWVPTPSTKPSMPCPPSAKSWILTAFVDADQGCIL